MKATRHKFRQINDLSITRHYYKITTVSLNCKARAISLIPQLPLTIGTKRLQKQRYVGTKC